MAPRARRVHLDSIRGALLGVQHEVQPDDLLKLGFMLCVVRHGFGPCALMAFVECHVAERVSRVWTVYAALLSVRGDVCRAASVTHGHSHTGLRAFGLCAVLGCLLPQESPGTYGPRPKARHPWRSGGSSNHR